MPNRRLAQWNEEYLSMAEEDMERLEAEYHNLLEYSKNDASTKTEYTYIKTCYIPKLFLRKDMDRLSEDMEFLMGILRKVVKHFFKDVSYRKLFRFTPEEEKLALQGRYERCLLPIARFDLFYNEETGDYKFCELNTDGSSAMNEDRELHIGEERFSSVYRKFRKRYHTSTYELFETWVKIVIRLYQSIRKTEELPSVAIVDFTECATINEFQVFADTFRQFGVRAAICDVRELHYDGGRLSDQEGNTYDVVYRRAVTADVLIHLEESQPLIQAAADDHILLLGDFHTQIIHNKAISVMLRHPKTYEFLEQEEIRYLEDHFPKTRFYSEEDRNMIMEEPEKWVLKPVDGYASQGIFAGVEYTREEWKKIVPQIPTENYILQEFCEPYATENYGETEKDVFARRFYNHLTGVFLYDGHFAGIYSRASIPHTLSVKDDEIALPTLIIETEG